jgi:hypothetical protein
LIIAYESVKAKNPKKKPFFVLQAQSCTTRTKTGVSNRYFAGSIWPASMVFAVLKEVQVEILLYITTIGQLMRDLIGAQGHI